MSFLGQELLFILPYTYLFHCWLPIMENIILDFQFQFICRHSPFRINPSLFELKTLSHSFTNFVKEDDSFQSLDFSSLIFSFLFKAHAFVWENLTFCFRISFTFKVPLGNFMSNVYVWRFSYLHRLHKSTICQCFTIDWNLRIQEMIF